MERKDYSKMVSELLHLGAKHNMHLRTFLCSYKLLPKTITFTDYCIDFPRKVYDIDFCLNGLYRLLRVILIRFINTEKRDICI